LSNSSSFMAEGGDTTSQADSNKEFKGKQAKVRVYYADWIRFTAILLVIFVHCLCNAFDASGLNPDDVPTIQQKKDGIIKSLVQIGIPMFFYISGVGSTFFDTEKKNYCIFLWEKILRLLLPFFIAIIVFLMPRLYFGQTYEDFTRPDDVIENDYGTFMLKTFPTVYQKLSWLWYLPALFIDFVLTYPLLRFTIRRSRNIDFSITDAGIIFL
jgi:surface polysaccharide O-acyltransferase-like enzyme